MPVHEWHDTPCYNVDDLFSCHCLHTCIVGKTVSLFNGDVYVMQYDVQYNVHGWWPLLLICRSKNEARCSIVGYVCAVWFNTNTQLRSKFFCVRHMHKKLAPYGTDVPLLLTANFKVTWHRNWDKIQKSGPDKL